MHLLSFHDIELYSLLISNAVQKLCLNSYLVNKNIILCVIPVDKLITISNIKPFDSAQDQDNQHQPIYLTQGLGCGKISKGHGLL